MAKRTYGSGTEINHDTDSTDSYVTKSIQPKKVSKKVYIIFGIIVGILFIVAIVFGILAYKSNKDNQHATQLWNNVRDIADKDDTSDDTSGLSETEGYSTDPMDREIDFESLTSINSDFLCWIYVPGTNIDYPVMQEPNFDETYYLNRNIYKVTQTGGSLLVPAEMDSFEGEDAHMIIFGHRMKNDTMFGTLVNYKEESFYKEYPYIYLYYPDHTERYSVFAAEHLLKTNKVYDMPYMYNTEEYETLLSDLIKNSLYSTVISEVESSEKTLTLSTCDNVEGNGTGRFTVNAVLDRSVSSTGVDLLDSVNHSLISNNSNVIIEEDNSDTTGQSEPVYRDSSDTLNIGN